MKKYVKIGGHIKQKKKKNGQDNISAIAGQSAFYIILSFVPFLMFVFAMLTYLGIPSDWYNENFATILPININEYISQIIKSAYDSAVGMAFTTIIIALWSAGKGIYSITQGIIIIYNSGKKKNWFLKRIQAVIYTLLMFIAIVLSIVLLVASQLFDNVIVSWLPDLPYFIYVIYGLRYIIIFLLLVIIIAFALKSLLYFNIKDKKIAGFKMQLPGAILIALSWTLLSGAISLYVTYFGGFSIYGSLGAAAVIMIWLYFAMYIFLCCIQFNYIYRFKIKRIVYGIKKKK